MSKPDADFTVAVHELRQVADTISQGASFFESQISEGLPVASVTDSSKQYAKDVLQAATQHLLNIADLVDGTIADQSTAVNDLDTSCQTLLQSVVATQAVVGLDHLSSLQTPISMHRYPKAYSPAAFETSKVPVRSQAQ
ncbi:hypothetical protein ABBQ38_011764 [Trebouxia sp. C0009 RCD-2024]